MFELEFYVASIGVCSEGEYRYCVSLAQIWGGPNMKMFVYYHPPFSVGDTIRLRLVENE